MAIAEVVTGADVSARAASRADLSRVVANAAQMSSAAVDQADEKQAKTVSCTSPEERFQMISEAAWFRAELRGFIAGDDLADWLAAETEVDTRLLGDDQPQSSR